MVFIEGISNDVATVLLSLFALVIVILAWLSTNVREYIFPANLLIIERRSRRLYTTSANNRNRRLSTTTTPATSTSSSSANPPPVATTTTHSAAAIRLNANGSIRSATYSQLNLLNHHTASAAVAAVTAAVVDQRSSELDLVNETVEQALVDNLLNETFYTTDELDQQQPTNMIGDEILVGIDAHQPESTTSISGGAASSILSEDGDDEDENDEDEDDTTETNNEEDTATTESTSISQQPVNATTLRESSSSESLSSCAINILIRFVNEKEMRIQAKPSDTILFLKKTHFSQELSSNKIVRFIYQGQFLSDKNTVKSYNIRDQTTIHCHITTRNPSTTATTSSSQSSSDSATLRQRLQNHQMNSITLRAASLDTNNNNNSESSEQQQQNPTTASNTGDDRHHNHQQQPFNTTIINVDLNNFLLPFCTVILAACWYFRVNFKQFFSPLTTLILIIFTFIYAMFLFNNIHSTSTLAANNLILHHRRRVFTRLQQQQPQPAHL